MMIEKARIHGYNEIHVDDTIQMKQRILFSVILILLIVYVRYCWRFPEDMVITQIPYHAFTKSLLTEKQPILVSNVPSDISVLQLMKHTYVWKISQEHNVEHRTLCKRAAWTALSCTSNHDECQLRLVRPQYGSYPHNMQTPGSIVMLPKHHVLLLPFRWSYQPIDGKDKCNAIAFYDIIHSIASLASSVFQ
jgi:hypothetical protein